MPKIDDIGLLASMRWHKFSEAVIYSRMSPNTLKRYIIKGDVYGTKRGGLWIIDRESIDKFYNRQRDEFELEVAEMMGRI